MDWFVTVNWLDTSASGGAFGATFKRGVKRMVQWLHDHGHPAIYIYVHENPGGSKPNTHFLIHLPKFLQNAFAEKVGKWFDAATDEAVQVVPRVEPGITKDQRLNYMIKGAHFLTCQSFGGHRARGGQGPMDFKRSGVSQHLRDHFGPPTRAGNLRRLPQRKSAASIHGYDLRDARHQLVLTQEEVAALADLHRNTVARLEGKKAIPRRSMKAAKAIKRALQQIAKQQPARISRPVMRARVMGSY